MDDIDVGGSQLRAEPKDKVAVVLRYRHQMVRALQFPSEVKRIAGEEVKRMGVYRVGDPQQVRRNSGGDALQPRKMRVNVVDAHFLHLPGKVDALWEYRKGQQEIPRTTNRLPDGPSKRPKVAARGARKEVELSRQNRPGEKWAVVREWQEFARLCMHGGPNGVPQRKDAHLRAELANGKHLGEDKSLRQRWKPLQQIGDLQWSRPILTTVHLSQPRRQPGNTGAPGRPTRARADTARCAGRRDDWWATESAKRDMGPQ